MLGKGVAKVFPGGDVPGNDVLLQSDFERGFFFIESAQVIWPLAGVPGQNIHGVFWGDLRVVLGTGQAVACIERFLPGIDVFQVVGQRPHEAQRRNGLAREQVMFAQSNVNMGQSFNQVTGF